MLAFQDLELLGPPANPAVRFLSVSPATPSATPRTLGAKCTPRTWRRPRPTAASGPQGVVAGGLASGRGGAGPIARHCGPNHPSPFPSPGSGAGAESHQLPLALPLALPPSLPLLASPGFHVCTSYLAAEAAVQLGSQEQQRGNQWDQGGMGQGSWNPAPDLGQGSGPSPFLPGFGGRSPETKCLGTGAVQLRETRHGAWNSRNFEPESGTQVEPQARLLSLLYRFSHKTPEKQGVG